MFSVYGITSQTFCGMLEQMIFHYMIGKWN